MTSRASQRITQDETSDAEVVDRARRLHAAGQISRFVLAAAQTPFPAPGANAWLLSRRRSRAYAIIALRWRGWGAAGTADDHGKPSPQLPPRPRMPTSQLPANIVEPYPSPRPLTLDRLRAVHIVSWACRWTRMHQLAAQSMRGDATARRRLDHLLYGRRG